MKNDDPWQVLIIDDEADIKEVVSIVLQDAGYLVETADDGLSGIEMCRKVMPQIVLTDIKMPGMSGLAVLEQLKKEFDAIEVVVMTAFGELEYAVKALQLDASDFITKPLHEESLQMAMKRAKERYSARQKVKEYTAFLEQENISLAKLLHRDKLISLGRLSASVVHEINNPLAGILNYSKLMGRILKQKELTPQYIEKFANYLQLIESESARVSDIVSSLLTFSRKNEPVISDVSVLKLINECVLLSRHRMELSQITFQSDVATDLPMVKGDFNQLQQCLINLIFNAVDAMTQGKDPDTHNDHIRPPDTTKHEHPRILNGGDFHINHKKSSKENDPIHFVRALKNLQINAFCDFDRGETGKEPHNGSVVIQVIDNGHGIEKEHFKKIFEPFFTTKAEGYGVGLGLSIIFGIMERHGGQVEVESEVGKGSTFSLRLPIPS